MAHHLTFFCRSGERTGSSAMAALLSELAQAGDPVLVRHPAAGGAGHVELATDDGLGRPAGDWIVLQFFTGIRRNAEIVISAAPDDRYGIWGSDLRVELILSGSATDWPLVRRIWAALVTLWSAVARDEMTGFDVSEDAPGSS